MYPPSSFFVEQKRGDLGTTSNKVITPNPQENDESYHTTEDTPFHFQVLQLKGSHRIVFEFFFRILDFRVVFSV